jgi:hypothetical protein|tara:strand:- start:57 stop:374 length:318 start_codon:yes stop_codon:yes gene_type:complete
MYYVIVLTDDKYLTEWLTRHRENALLNGMIFKVVTVPECAPKVGEWTRISMMPYSAHGKVLTSTVIHCDPNYVSPSGTTGHLCESVEECFLTFSHGAMGVLKTVR